MTSMAIALVLKPIVAVALLLPGAVLAHWLWKRMPDCAIKRVLLVSWKV